MLFFNDETGLNALPPGVLVTVTDAITGAEIGVGYTQFGGGVNIDVMGAVAHIATFQGTKVAATPCTFFGSAVAGADTVISVPGYRSPLKSQAGYAHAIASRYPRGDAWGGSAARKPGGGLWNLFSLGAAAPATMDQFTGELQAALRLPTCVNGDLDSWAADFFGNFLLRYQGESDALYQGRIVAAFGAHCTIDAIEALVNAFYQATLAERAQASQQNLAFDTGGSFGEATAPNQVDQGRGAFDVYIPPINESALIPTVDVWDAQTQPTLAAANNIAPPQFVIQIAVNITADAWFLDNSGLDVNAFLFNFGSLMQLPTPPDPRLAALVNLCKAAGTQPIYFVTDTTS